MLLGKRSLYALATITLGALPASAATTSIETYSFDATMTSGSVVCGDRFSDNATCAESLGAYSGATGDDLMRGKVVGETYNGQITLAFDGSELEAVSCTLGGENCYFGRNNLWGPFGEDANLNFSDEAFVLSAFQFAGDSGSYEFATDFFFEENGYRYYDSVEFDLSNVVRDVSIVPLSGSAGFLLFALGGFAFAARRKSRAG